VLAQDAAGNWSVSVTGEQGSGILRSMAEANCFIILPEAQGNVTAGATVECRSWKAWRSRRFSASPPALPD
jgi:molybdopterin molybdotransferase